MDGSKLLWPHVRFAALRRRTARQEPGSRRVARDDPSGPLAQGLLGSAWLSVSPASGNTLAGQAGTTLTVTVSPSGPVAPGTLVAIFVVTAPVFVVTPGQINAMLPFGLAVNTDLPIVVTRNNAVSAPQSVSVVSSLPSVFTQNQSGQGLGAIIILHPDGSWNLAGANSPAHAGDTLEIYCTGLGDTNPRTVSGFPATASPLLWAIDQVTLTVGGVNVPVSFYGLTPGLAGLFQVNATLPTGIAPSPQAPVVLSQGGRAGVMVTIPIQ